jgi:ketosteroid isomerase-like protein
MTPPDGPTVVRAGYTLTFLRRERDKWLLAHDANMLAPVPDPA